VSRIGLERANTGNRRFGAGFNSRPHPSFNHPP